MAKVQANAAECKRASAKVIQFKGSVHRMLPQTEADLFYRWRHRKVRPASLARTFQIPPSQVDDIIRERLFGEGEAA